MNFDVVLLFGNAILVTVVSVAAVLRILWREYRPAIERAERESAGAQRTSDTDEPGR